jgi:hypothetical protein
MSNTSEILTVDLANGISLDYEIIFGEARTRNEPGAQDDYNIITAYADGDDIGEFLDRLEANGISCWERLYDKIAESAPSEHELQMDARLDDRDDR